MNKEIANNLNNLTEMGDIDPNQFTYANLKEIAKKNGIDINDISKAMNISITTTNSHAKANNGVIGSKYFYILVGMIALRKQSKLKIIE